MQCAVVALFLLSERRRRRENELSQQIFGKKENRQCERGKYLSYVLLNVAIISGCVLLDITQVLLGFFSLVNKRFAASLQAT